MTSNSNPTNREQALCLLALALVSLTNDTSVLDSSDKKFRKQFVDHLVSHGIEKARANHLHTLVQSELQPQLF